MDPSFVGLFGLVVGLAFAALLLAAGQLRAWVFFSVPLLLPLPLPLPPAGQLRAWVFFSEGPRADDPWTPTWSASTGSGDGSRPHRRRSAADNDPALPLRIEDFTARRAMIVRALRKCGVRTADLEDVAEAVIEGAWNSRASWRPECCCFDTFLWAIARNLSVNYQRQTYNRRVDLVDPIDSVFDLAADETPESALEHEESVQRARAIVARLRPRNRDVFIAYEIEGAEMRDVSAALGVEFSTCWGRLQRARKEVRRWVATQAAIEARPRPRRRR